MYRKCGFIRKVVHYVLILSLLLTTIASGFSPVEVLAEEESVSTGTEYVFYVDGVGSGQKDGTSKDNALATVEAAYEKIPSGATKTTIVICGNVKPYEGALDLKTDHYRFAVHTGKVIITSVYGQEDYKETAKIDFEGKNYYFLGDTTFENISIGNLTEDISKTGKANYIFANYFPFHLGKGISVADSFAKRIYLGTGSSVNGSGGNKTTVSIADTSFIMESGTVDVVYGGGDSYQGKQAIGKDNKVTITINGGTVTTLYGSGHGNTDNAHHKSVEITVNEDGMVDKLYGAHGDATIYDDVSININGGTVNSLYGACKYNYINGNSDKFTPQIKGNVIVTLKGGTITNLNAKEDGAVVEGKLVFQYPDNAQGVTLPTAQGFNTLRLTDASTLKAATDAADATIENNPDATVEIDLLADVIAPADVTVGEKVTLDLNGNTLDMGDNYLLSNGNVVDSSENKAGRLKIATMIVEVEVDGKKQSVVKPKGKLAENNSQMPVYDTEKDGYAFADITEQLRNNTVQGSDVFDLVFRPSFGTNNTLLAGGSDATKVNVIIRLEWKEDGNPMTPVDLKYTDEMVKTVYGNEKMAFYIKASGIQSVDDLTITPMVVSNDLGVEWSNTSFTNFTVTE